MQDFLKIHDRDNVIVALQTLPRGTKVSLGEGDIVAAHEEIPAGHKMAIRDIPVGSEVIKYGYCIGNAKDDIKAGDWIHIHNVKTALGDLLEYTYEPISVGSTEKNTVEDTAETENIAGTANTARTEDVTFLGFNRPDGKVGVRNEIWIIPTVGCVNNVATAIAKQANAYVKDAIADGRHGKLCMIAGKRSINYFLESRPKWFLNKKAASFSL